jgi:beta-glucosidase
MTLDEKIHLLKGSGLTSAMGNVDPGEGIPGVVGTIVATPRLGLASINLSDGPAGLRIEPIREGEERTYYCTAFPIATLLSST